ncbi:PQQ-dependent sugar dehydrogenase, partial [Micromonospora zhanjiangensis]
MSSSTRRRRRSLYRWAAGACALLLAPVAAITAKPAPAQAFPINASDFQRVTLARGVAQLGEPMSIAVLPDRSVLQTARDGTLRRADAAGNVSVVARIPVYTHDEEGLQGVGVDPNFASNRYIYLYYSPQLSTPGGDAPDNGTDFSAWKGYNRLSRFTLTTNWQLQNETKILEVGTDRGICCHVGGGIDFDGAGNLYLSTGDDSNPFQSAGYSPLDERTNRNPAFDAQRSAANSNDLRGKILRIKVNDDGSYSIPSGNMFAPGTANTRPEIYAMGFRNPFRIGVDKATGIVYVGDYGPDAGSTNPNRGPSGQVEFDRVTAPGNFGWPYCTGSNSTNETYNKWNFANNTTGPKFDCANGPTNSSPRNTGVSKLPKAQPAWIRYAGDAGSPPEFGGGSESPMGGPVYRYDPNNPSNTKFPPAFDGYFMAGEYGRGWIKPIRVGADGSYGDISNFPWGGKQVMDMKFGPDGALYVLDYGSGCCTGDTGSAIYRYDYVGSGNRAPTAVASADRTSGQAPLTVNFSSAGSADPEGGTLRYSWNFGDGTTSTAANPAHTFTADGVYNVKLTVTDPQGATGTATVQIGVGNTAPTVTINKPASGQLFNYGDTVDFDITVTDPEDGTVDCGKVTMAYLLGHDQHSHQITSKNGCTGSITIPIDGEHDAAANIYGVFDASYIDAGGLTTHKQHVLQPRHRQAEHYKNASGVAPQDKPEAEGGRTVGDINNGEWISFDTYNLSTATSISARVSSAGAGGTIQVRTGSPTGTVLGSVTVPVTGGWNVFTTVTGSISNPPPGTQTLYLTFAGSGTGVLFDVDAFTFNSGPSGGTRTGRVTGLGGKCLDINGAGTADGTKIQLWSCNGGTNQTWTIDGQVWRNPNSNKCLDATGGGTANGTKVQLFTCTGGAGQNWAAQADGSVRNPQSNRCLDVSGNNSADGTQVQIWD